MYRDIFNISTTNGWYGYKYSDMCVPGTMNGKYIMHIYRCLFPIIQFLYFQCLVPSHASPPTLMTYTPLCGPDSVDLHNAMDNECMLPLVKMIIQQATVYPKKYAHGFVVLCFVVVMQSFIMNSHEVFIHIH